MNKQIFLPLIILILMGLGINQIFAADDFEIRPPVMIPDKDPSAIPEEPQRPTGMMSFIDDLDANSPLYFVSLGYKSEDTWFDRRVNWASFEGLLHFEYHHFGIRLQTSMSSAGRDEFKLFDSRATLYWFDEHDEKMIRWGAGISVFDVEPYRYQSFLNDQFLAVYGTIDILVFEAKLIFLINDNDDIWNGGLFELKLVNPFRIFGFHLKKNVSNMYQTFIFLNAMLPIEIGLTGSFGLPNHSSHLGWHVMFRYAFEFQISDNNSMGFQFYYGYKNGSSESWEVGIKFNFMGY